MATKRKPTKRERVRSAARHTVKVGRRARKVHRRITRPVKTFRWHI